MHVLTNWDDLIHGTAVFSAAVPFFIAFLIALKTPSPYWWAAAAAALFIPFLWLFKFPGFPASSEDVAIFGLLITVAAAFKQTRLLSPVLFAALAWFIYPAWLAEDGGLSRKILITLGMTAFIVGTSNTTSSRISIAAFLPPAIALAVLLQLGGAGRFAQATGAICSVITAFCIIILWKKLKPENLSKLPVALLALFAWSGWLFAELRWGLALLLFTAPLASYAVSFLPVKKIPPMLRDALASAAIAIPIAAIALSDYLADSADSEGY